MSEQHHLANTWPQVSLDRCRGIVLITLPTDSVEIRRD